MGMGGRAARRKPFEATFSHVSPRFSIFLCGFKPSFHHFSSCPHGFWTVFGGAGTDPALGQLDGGRHGGQPAGYLQELLAAGAPRLQRFEAKRCF